MNKKIIIIGSIIIIVIFIASLIFVNLNKPKEKEENIPNLTKSVEIDGYKIDEISISSKDKKIKIVFNITNISKEVKNNEKVYIELQGEKGKKLETLQATIAPSMQINETKSVEAYGTIVKNKVKNIKYSIK